MSAKIWLMVGLLAAICRCPPRLNKRPRKRRSRAAAWPCTTDGDAGLWWLPVADTNGKKKHRGSAQRNSFNTPQGQMNVANFTANVSYGLTDRFDVFGAWDFIQRVDRDNQHAVQQPIRTAAASIPARRLRNERWTGNKIGDLRVGAKYGILSEAEGDSFSFASRVFVNLPTGDADEGGGQGGVAADVSGVLSKWLNRNARADRRGWLQLPQESRSDPIVAHVPELPALGRGPRHHAE